MKTIESITGSGGSKVISESSLQSGLLAVKGSGGCNLTLQINAEDLKCKSSGGSKLDIKGNADKLYATCREGMVRVGIIIFKSRSLYTCC